MYVETALGDDTYINAKGFVEALNASTKNIVMASAKYSEEGWKEQASKHLGSVASEARKLQQAAIARAQNLDKRWKEWLSPPKTVSPDRFSELRSHLRGLKPAEVLRLTTQDGLMALAALESPEGIPGMNDTGIVKHVERAAALYSLKDAYAAQMQQKPDLNNPLAYGRDENALQNIAEEALKNFEQAQVTVKATGEILNKTVNYYALVADVSPHEAFDAMGLGK